MPLVLFLAYQEPRPEVGGAIRAGRPEPSRAWKVRCCYSDLQQQVVRAACGPAKHGVVAAINRSICHRPNSQKPWCYDCTKPKLFTEPCTWSKSLKDAMVAQP
eukprot:scaffold25134_cov13-Tisochrysis_lutea.AAC.1